ncbi:MAG: hypothetical protein LUG91_00795 [Ruminococcus sp.]|nr:hypothetical protein [Ruminococcus sp.]
MTEVTYGGSRLYTDNSGGTITANQLALIYAIIASREVGAGCALRKFGICPPHNVSEREKNAKYRTMGEAAYILIGIYGVLRKDATAALGVHWQLVNRALQYIGYKKDGRKPHLAKHRGGAVNICNMNL